MYGSVPGWGRWYNFSMKKLSRVLVSMFLAMICIALVVSPFRFKTFSGDIEDLENQVNENQEELEKNKTLLEQIESRINEINNSKYSLSEKISLIEDEISSLQEDIDVKNTEIEAKLKEIEEKENLLDKKKSLLNDISGDLYVASRFGFLNSLFSGKGLDELIENLYVRKSAISVLTDDIEEISGEFSSLAEAKSNLEGEKKELDEEKKALDESYDLLAAEKSKLQTELNAQIAEKNAVKKTIGGITLKITQLQQTILYLKGGGGLSNADAVSSNATPTTQLKYFRDNAPSGTFGIFSFGASTHRNGMSQYGALARAEDGQSYETILQAYYPGTTLDKNYSEPENIHIKGTGDSCTCQRYNGDGSCASYEKSYDEWVSFSTYMNRIYEMSSSWSIEAVKAQTIASRSYAIAQINANGYVKPSQSDQVYKDCDNNETWRNVVNMTKNQVLVSGSGAYKAFFAAVHGGWSNTMNDYDVWSGSEAWYLRAWEAKSGVNWFYMNWYQRKVGRNYVSCSTKPNPWLTGEELADILNAYKYWMSLGTSDTKIDPRLTAIDVQTCWGDSANPYSHSELKSLVDDPINKVLTAEAVNSSGWTTELRFSVKLESGAISSYTISGTNKTLAFRDIFNLRAPGYFSIPQADSSSQVGGGFVHINIETGIN